MPDSQLSHPQLPIVLCIGGLDPSGGAGIAADARACSAFGALALSVATAIVVQNTRSVRLIEPIQPAILTAQIETLLEDIRPSAVKIGMLPDAAAVEVVAALLRPLQNRIPIVMDTVFAPSSGPTFNDNSTIDIIARQLLPLASVVTPNALEARQLGAEAISGLDSMKRAAQMIFERTGAGNVLLKGGHLSDPEYAVDLFFDGTQSFELRARREGAYEVRGTGCLLASAMAAGLAGGKAPLDAARDAKDWLTEQYRNAHSVGGGRRVTAIGPIDIQRKISLVT
jgi:hydroxymethylpyrimidine kinase/phosphomethylpyrimidine kinase